MQKRYGRCCKYILTLNADYDKINSKPKLIIFLTQGMILMNKKATFFVDDVLWVFRDLTRERPASMWDNSYMGMLKEAHDKYGAKIQLNVFYRTCFWYNDDEFSLADMTDAYKHEFEESSEWLKLAFHSKEEWPDYPFINADYEVVDRVFKLIKN